MEKIINEIPPLIIVLTALSLLSFLFFRVRLAGEDRKVLSNIFIIGLLIRLFLAVAVTPQVDPYIFAGDDVWYDQLGWGIAKHWQETGTYSLPDDLPAAVTIVYNIYNGIVYYIFGHAPLVPKVINCFVGSFIAIYIFFITRHLFSRKAAILAAFLTQFFPSLILWSTLNLRDTFIIFALVMIIWKIITLQTKFKICSLIPLFLSLLVIYLLRLPLLLPIFLSVVISMVIGIIIPQRGKFFYSAATGIILLISIFIMYQELRIGLPLRLEPDALLGWAAIRRAGIMASGGSVFYSDIDISTPAKALKFLPIGITYFLFAPFPWSIISFRQIFTIFEMPVWYLLFLKIIGGTLFVVRNKFRESAIILIYLVITTASLSLVAGNIGLAYRLRAQVLPFFLILAAVGIVERGKTGKR